ncbi:MAG: hypothetical protein JWQ52_499 [Phenylobacterium sp.]|nr:hypothetical protein [Phenylobacterium sp.]
MSTTPLRATELYRRSDRFDSLTIAMHWITLLLLVVLFVAAWTFGRATDAATAESVLLLHRSTGYGRAPVRTDLIQAWMETQFRSGRGATAHGRPTIWPNRDIPS